MFAGALLRFTRGMVQRKTTMSRLTRREFFTARLARDPGPSDSSRTLKATIDSRCLALNRVVCRTCGESCEAGAIHFRLAVGGVSTPHVDPGACNGCSDCVRACPVGAIAMRQSLQESAA